MALVWRDTMSIGHAEIDSDHKKILTLVNATEKYISEWNPVLLGEILERTKELIAGHFVREEALAESVGFPECESHAALHREDKRKIFLIYNKFNEFKEDDKRKTCATLLLHFLNEYVVNHIIKEDLKLKAYVKKSVGDSQVWSMDDINKSQSERNIRNKDIEYELPPDLAHLFQRIEYIVPPMPAPQSDFADFDVLCEAAICYRIDKVLVFFHRHNPAVARELPPNFILSPEFADKFRQAVSRLIFPTIRASRQVQLLSTNFNWSGVDSENFWNHVTPLLKDAILFSWSAAWDALKLVPVTKDDGTKILKVVDETKLLREMLQPSDPAAYDLPRIGNREIETFKSLLDTNTDWWARLNRAWTICHDIYEQEKDPRIFQQKARAGALRDNLLAAFDDLPEQWGDFVVLACHRVFPRVSTLFLESFTTNFGRNKESREAYVPYTMHYLKQAHQRPEIRQRELQEEANWQAQAKKLRDYLTGRTAALAADQRLASQNPAGEFKRTVLVVDDIDYMRKQMGHILRSAGIANVVETDEGGQAFELLRAAPEVYGLVIADLDMNPTNGLHLLTILRKDDMTPAAVRNIPYIMLTSDASPDAVAEIRNAGANGVVVKPFTAATLISTVRKVIGQ